MFFLGIIGEYLTIILNYNKNLPIVIDHIAKPKIVDQEIDEWKNDIKKLSALENLDPASFKKLKIASITSIILLVIWLILIFYSFILLIYTYLTPGRRIY